MFEGDTICVKRLGDGFVELCFDRRGARINKLDALTLREFRNAISTIGATAGLRGVLLTSAKEGFALGADITEFSAMFDLPVEELTQRISEANKVFTALEDLEIPSVAALDGHVLGGGLEIALAAALRIATPQAQLGLPEVKLGLIPGYGGTVRLPRVAGLRTALDWVISGAARSAQAALDAGVVDAVVPAEKLRDEALALLDRAANGVIAWRDIQKRKRTPLPLLTDEQSGALGAVKAALSKINSSHLPAPRMAAELLEWATRLSSTVALAEESKTFVQLAKTQAASALTRTFLNQQALKRDAKHSTSSSIAIRKAGVLGAGIMGGGIAFSCALGGTSVRLKDIDTKQLELGRNEVLQQLAKLSNHGRISAEKAQALCEQIHTQLGYESFDDIDVKRRVFVELEQMVGPDTVIASNTSSLRIHDLAAPLTRPQNLVGMHFFNPVPKMPLVEIVRGAQTSDVAVAVAVSYVLTMGKTPIVVMDCPGFLVNRVFTAYMRGFLQLVADGADFEAVDRIMEGFGWPMGPAYLEDVIGLDTGSHVNDVISAGYPQRMPSLGIDPLRLMVTHHRLGQKNGAGFYRYEVDARGSRRRIVDLEAKSLLASIQPHGPREFGEEEVIDRLMLPMLIEAVHALEDGVVANPAALDTALLLGLGFPAHLGGILQYADWVGLDGIVARAAKYQGLGTAYIPTPQMVEMAKNHRRFHD